MEKLKEALNVIKEECAKYDDCRDCPLYTFDDVYGGNYCSVTREGNAPAEWKVEEMVNG